MTKTFTPIGHALVRLKRLGLSLAGATLLALLGLVIATGIAGVLSDSQARESRDPVVRARLEPRSVDPNFSEGSVTNSRPLSKEGQRKQRDSEAAADLETEGAFGFSPSGKLPPIDDVASSLPALPEPVKITYAQASDQRLRFKNGICLPQVFCSDVFDTAGKRSKEQTRLSDLNGKAANV